MSTPSDPGPGESGRPDGVAAGPGSAWGDGSSAGHSSPQSPGGEQTPACYRHPGRETYVSCVRCGRYACPDCMRVASVGQQCVECVGEGARSTRQARTTFGGRPVAGALVTWTLVAINVAVFLIAWARPAIINDLAMLGYSPYTAGGPQHGVAAGEWYRLITSAFVVPGAGLSGLGFVDILFNMWALVFVGPALEGLLGRVRFLAVYLLSAVGGGVMYYYLAPPENLAAGASGAIYGLFGAWFVVSRRLRADTRGIVTLIAINLVISFVWHAIAWQAHIGGLLTGALLTAAYAYAPRRNRAAFQVAATVLVVVVIVVAVVVRNAQLTSGTV